MPVTGFLVSSLRTTTAQVKDGRRLDTDDIQRDLVVDKRMKLQAIILISSFGAPYGAVMRHMNQ